MFCYCPGEGNELPLPQFICEGDGVPYLCSCRPYCGVIFYDCPFKLCLCLLVTIARIMTILHFICLHNDCERSETFHHKLGHIQIPGSTWGLEVSSNPSLAQINSYPLRSYHIISISRVFNGNFNGKRCKVLRLIVG